MYSWAIATRVVQEAAENAEFFAKYFLVMVKMDV